jgi:hypothetical protein
MPSEQWNNVEGSLLRRSRGIKRSARYACVSQRFIAASLHARRKSPLQSLDSMERAVPHSFQHAWRYEIGAFGPRKRFC